jgi:hypothetical protein
MSLETLRALERRIEKEVPSFTIRFKNESPLMQALGALMYPFNQSFLADYTTTIGPTVYFPSKRDYEADPDSSLVTLAHEYVHIYDSKQAGFRFQLSYAAPQVYMLPVTLLYGILVTPWPVAVMIGAFVSFAILAKELKKPWLFWVLFVPAILCALVWAVLASGWLSLLLVAGLAFLGPWPSAGRTHWELRGYMMSVAVMAWRSAVALPDETIVFFAKQFTGPDYYFMARGNDPEFELRVAMNRALKGQLQLDAPYSTVHDFLVQQQRVSGRPA